MSDDELPWRASAERMAAEMEIARRPQADAEIAWRLFEHIRGRDPEAASTATSAIAVFKECMAAIRHQPSGWAETAAQWSDEKGD